MKVERMILRTPAMALLALFWTAAGVLSAGAGEGGFPFGHELRLDVNPMTGSKRVPSMEIGTNGEAVLELWCKGGGGQFSVANDTVIFIPSPTQDRTCPPDRAAADDALMQTLAAATHWTRAGDILTLHGARNLRFRINTN
jgi:heat shock protein HslJ